MAQLSARSAICEEQEYESKLLVIPEATRGDGAFKCWVYLPSIHSQLYELHAVSRIDQHHKELYAVAFQSWYHRCICREGKAQHSC